MIPFGPFDVQKQIARGGAAEIWQGKQREQGVEVALKILSPPEPHSGGPRSFDSAFQASFENEVRAIAGLTHPSIISVYDFGQIPEHVAEASQGQLKAQAPYLVMELADHSLRPWAGHLTWEILRSVLLSLLDALAHSHARGVIHLDLKVENVLVFQGGSAIKLTDFGLAHVSGPRQEQGEQVIAGTPAYMPPEQLKGEWRNYGPWTDLYALGCLAYLLASGELPFAHALNFHELMACHLYHSFPPLKAPLGVPDGFETWIHRLVKKPFARRFQRASDAAWALLELDEDGETLRSPGVAPAVAPSEVSEPLFTLQVTFEQLPLAPHELSDEPLPTHDGSPLEESPQKQDFDPMEYVPPLPLAWSGGEILEPQQLHSVGLGLFGLRTVPMVDRYDEREYLWRMLAHVHRYRSSHLVLLRGAAGCGKSRLASWLLERAHEVGAAIVLKAHHNPLHGPSDGLGPMCARYFRCTDLSRAQTAERLAQLYPSSELDWGALAELFQPLSGSDSSDSLVRFGSSLERYETIRQSLERLCQQRLVVVWLDDVQWGLDALEFALYLLKSQQRQSLPILLVATVREEALDSRPQAATVVEQLLQRPEVSALPVPPLPREFRQELIGRLLRLEPSLAAEVEACTEGNPLFATQLLGEWVHRGKLVPAPGGFQVKGGQLLELPKGMEQFWSQRLAGLLEGRDAKDGLALELAAALGHEVDSQEWQSVCGLACLEAPFGIVEHLLKLGLAVAGAEGSRHSWSFVHEKLRAAIERRAREAGRWEAHHHLCAEAVRHTQGPHTQERIARHLHAGAMAQEALDSFLKAAQKRVERSDYRMAEELLDDVEKLLAHLQLDEADPRWGQLWLHRGELSLSRGELQEAEFWTHQIAHSPHNHLWTDIKVPWLLLTAHVYTNSGRTQASLNAAERALEVAKQSHDLKQLAQATMRLGRSQLEVGQPEQAKATLSQALAQFEAIEDDYGMGYTYLILSNVATRQSMYDKSEEYTRQAIPCFERCGSRVNLAHSSVFLGETLRLRGKFEEALRCYQHAIHLFHATGSALLDAIPRLNQGLILLERQRFEQAYEALVDLPGQFQLRGRPELAGASHIFLFACAIFMHDWTGAQNHYYKAAANFKDIEHHDVDTARFAQMAGHFAKEQGQLALALQAYRFSLHQWEIMGRPLDAAQVQAVLEGLEQR